MTEVLEIYRPILGNGAEELAKLSFRIAEEFDLTGDISVLNWGEEPRVSIATIGGSLATDIYDNDLERLGAVASLGSNGSVLEPDLRIWGWDLPRADGTYPIGRKRPKNIKSREPKIEIAEDREDNGLYRVANDELWRVFDEAIQFSRHGNKLSGGQKISIKYRVMRSIHLVGLDPTYVNISQSDIRKRWRGLKTIIPPIGLGPVEVEIYKKDEYQPENLGYLVRLKR